MKKNDLIKILDEIFVPIGFKRKGNNWVLNSGELSKLINLQKSNYSNTFYINYGYVIKGLELTTKTHIENRLASTNKEEQKKITNLLDFEIEIPLEQRKKEIKELITDKIALQMQSINTEKDIMSDLLNRSNLNDVPLVVKRHFKLRE